MDRVSFWEAGLMHRFYCPVSVSPGTIVSLSPEESYHALRVLRLEKGGSVEIIAASGRFSSVITDISENRISVEILSLLPSSEPALSITLFQGLPKSGKMEWIVQKAVELGVVRIIPVEMSRSVGRIRESDQHKKTDRLQKIAAEAAKQSGRSIIPAVNEPIRFKDIDNLLNDIGLLAVPWENSSSYGPLAFKKEHPDIRSLGILIGPEGGISFEEMNHLINLNCVPMTLGPRIMRTETAGLAAVSSFLAIYGEME